MEINFEEVKRCIYCSEKWGFCSYHCDKYCIDYKGNPKPKESLNKSEEPIEEWLPGAACS